MDAERVAVEWWAVKRADGTPETLVGCLAVHSPGAGAPQAPRNSSRRWLSWSGAWTGTQWSTLSMRS
jgi:hypothetical protein